MIYAWSKRKLVAFTKLCSFFSNASIACDWLKPMFINSSIKWSEGKGGTGGGGDGLIECEMMGEEVDEEGKGGNSLGGMAGEEWVDGCAFCIFQ